MPTIPATVPDANGKARFFAGNSPKTALFWQFPRQKALTCANIANDYFAKE